jgi:hypothetical protein
VIDRLGYAEQVHNGERGHLFKRYVLKEAEIDLSASVDVD